MHEQTGKCFLELLRLVTDSFSREAHGRENRKKLFWFFSLATYPYCRQGLMTEKTAKCFELDMGSRLSVESFLFGRPVTSEQKGVQACGV